MKEPEPSTDAAQRAAQAADPDANSVDGRGRTDR